MYTFSNFITQQITFFLYFCSRKTFGVKKRHALKRYKNNGKMKLNTIIAPLLLLFGVVILSLNVFAQNKGDKYVMALMNASFKKVSSNSTEEPWSAYLGLGTGFGYFIDKNCRLELDLGVYYQNDPIELLNAAWLYDYYKGFTVCPNYSYYVKLDKNNPKQKAFMSNLPKGFIIHLKLESILSLGRILTRRTIQQLGTSLTKVSLSMRICWHYLIEQVLILHFGLM